MRWKLLASVSLTLTDSCPVMQLYHHGEDIAVNVHIANNSNRTVKKIKVTGEDLHMLDASEPLVTLVMLQCDSLQTSASSPRPSTSAR